LDEALKRAIREDPPLLERAELLSDLIEGANGEDLMKAILTNDDEALARALDVPLHDARELATFFHHAALKLAESHPQLREAAQYFGSKT